VFIGADPGGQDLGNGGVGDDREPPVDGPGGVGVPFIGDKAQGQGKGKDPVLVVDEDLAVIPRGDAPKDMAARVAKPMAKTVAL